MLIGKEDTTMTSKLAGLWQRLHLRWLLTAKSWSDHNVSALFVSFS